MINGNLSDPVCISRGVRQGCPLSPLLYVLFIEPIACYINSISKIRGFMIPGCNGTCVKFMQYADDATCIASNVNDIFQFIRIFDLFQCATGATINIGKSCGLKLGPLASVDIPLDIAWSCDSIKITGIRFGSEDAVKFGWQGIINSIIKLLDLWDHRRLSLIGKILLLNTIIFPKFYYVAPVYPIPAWVIKSTYKAVFMFLWGNNKPQLIARKVVFLIRTMGDWGLMTLSLK